MLTELGSKTQISGIPSSQKQRKHETVHKKLVEHKQLCFSTYELRALAHWKQTFSIWKTHKGTEVRKKNSSYPQKNTMPDIPYSTLI